MEVFYQSTSGFLAISHGRGRVSTPRSGSSLWQAELPFAAQCGWRWTRGPRWPWRRAPRGDGVSNGRVYTTGKLSSGATIFHSASLVRISRWPAYPTMRFVSAIDYRIGSALFEVTQPRVTCYRVGIRMAEPAMAALLVSHHRPGFYFRVLEEGEVGAGDEIVKVADGPERITVANVDALLYLPNPSRDQLERSLRVPALSSGWKTSFKGDCRTKDFRCW